MKPQAKGRGHGTTEFFIEGVGVIGAETLDTTASGPTIGGTPTPGAAAVPPSFRFVSMFGLPAFTPPANDLIELGEEMDDSLPANANSTIPSGFTYLGQFIDHDITFDESTLDESSVFTPNQLVQARSPSLDLDSLYGLGVDDTPQFYETDKLHFRLGQTTDRGLQKPPATPTVLPNDLPRNPPNPADPLESKRAIIADPRNDENLAVSQIHVAFLKFHNAVVDKIATNGNAAQRFLESQKIVTQHYQSIVLHDFLPRLVMQSVIDDVMQNGRSFFEPGGVPAGAHPAMPLEFSVGGYRLGHSMIRDLYNWNRVFSAGGSVGDFGSLDQLFEFSQVSGDFSGSPSVPTDWVVDFRRLFSFPATSNHVQLNFTRLIDTHLAVKLKNLAQFKQDPIPHRRSLAVRNLLRGRQVGLPTGQDVAAMIGVAPLSPAQVASGPHGPVLTQHNFHNQTPLWYYILKEAEVQQTGLRLGEVGSRILVETFHCLIEASRDSILKTQGWKPSLPSHDSSFFAMSDLLTFVNDLNPLGGA